LALLKTYTPKEHEIDRSWWLVDAEGKTLGRIATEIARLLRGKHKPSFTPHLDTGDYVVVVNASKVTLTGNKSEQKTYFTHSGFMGHERHIPFKTMMKKYPDRVIDLAVKGMLPKNTLGRKMREKLKIYAGTEHPHQGQVPQRVEF
jgi:large subunit ribosomal protein L13